VGIVRREVQALTRHTLPRTPPFFPFLPQNTNPGARVDGPIHRRCLPCIASLPKCKHDMTRWTIATLVLEHTRPLPRGILGLFRLSKSWTRVADRSHHCKGG